MNIKAIRELAEKYKTADLEACINDQLTKHTNSCYAGETEDEAIDSMSKASYVCQLMENDHLSLTDAIRKMAQVIRESN
ncbi:DUF6952 family protein [bacterium]